MRSFHAQWFWLLASLVVCVPASVFVAAAANPAGILLVALPALILLPLLCNSYSCRYQVYEFRIDFETGLFSKRIRSVWLWQIVDVEYDRPAIGWLTNTGRVQILADKRQGTQAAETASFEIVGLGSSSFMQNLREELIEAALLQRRAIKWWGM
jgi:membrane protein YdbS with pleckstrin-like domain